MRLMSSPQIGGTYAKPMLLPPEVAIGAFGRVQVHVHVQCHVYRCSGQTPCFEPVDMGIELLCRSELTIIKFITEAKS